MFMGFNITELQKAFDFLQTLPPLFTSVWLLSKKSFMIGTENEVYREAMILVGDIKKF